MLVVEVVVHMLELLAQAVQVVVEPVQLAAMLPQQERQTLAAEAEEAQPLVPVEAQAALES